MGLINCSIHGYQGFTINIDKKIVECILNEKELPDTHFYITKVDFYNEEEMLFQQKLLILTKTARENKIETYYKIIDENSELNLKWIFELTGGICGECFKEYFRRNNFNLQF